MSVTSFTVLRGYLGNLQKLPSIYVYLVKLESLSPSQALATRARICSLSLNTRALRSNAMQVGLKDYASCAFRDANFCTANDNIQRRQAVKAKWQIARQQLIVAWWGGLTKSEKRRMQAQSQAALILSTFRVQSICSISSLMHCPMSNAVSNMCGLRNLAAYEDYFCLFYVNYFLCSITGTYR